MNSTSNKPFHTYENVGYDDQVAHNHYATQIVTQPQPPPLSPPALAINNVGNNGTANIAINKNAIESPFSDPMNDSCSIASIPGPRILSATDSTGATRTLTSRAIPGQNLVTKLISLPSQSPMDSFREWSSSTLKCARQLINEKRGTCSITHDAQLQADIEQLYETRNRLVQMLRTAYQMNNHYSQLVESQLQLFNIMNEMACKCFTNNNINSINGQSKVPSNNNNNSNLQGRKSSGKHIVTNFSSLGNNLSSTTTTSPKHQPIQRPSSTDNLNDFLPVWNHMKNLNINIAEDLKKNAISLNAAIKNGKKFVAALTFFCSNLTTLINKTIEDTLLTVKHFESSRLEYDAERNSINLISSAAPTSMTYSSDRLELARERHEQLRQDVQIKMKLLEENTINVMHRQLQLFNSAFSSYSTGNTAALDATLKQFSIR